VIRSSCQRLKGKRSMTVGVRDRMRGEERLPAPGRCTVAPPERLRRDRCRELLRHGRWCAERPALGGRTGGGGGMKTARQAPVTPQTTAGRRRQHHVIRRDSRQRDVWR
jgi:hypothetical protein